MKTRKQKQESFSRIKEKLAKAKIAIFTSFAPASTGLGGQVGAKGLNVAGMKELRKALRPLESEYSVAKKTVLDKALSGKADVFKYSGSLGVMYSYADPYAAAKALYQFAKKNTAMKLFGGMMGDQTLDEAMVMEMALMPSREVLLGRLVGMLSYPMRSLVVVLNQIKHE